MPPFDRVEAKEIQTFNKTIAPLYGLRPGIPSLYSANFGAIEIRNIFVGSGLPSGLFFIAPLETRSGRERENRQPANRLLQKLKATKFCPIDCKFPTELWALQFLRVQSIK